MLVVTVSSKALQRIKDIQGIQVRYCGFCWCRFNLVNELVRDQRGIQDELPGLDTVAFESRWKPPRLIFEGILSRKLFPALILVQIL